MVDHQQVVQSIRAFLAGVDQTRSHEAEELAARYAELCREASSRLSRCVDHLRRGLRSEAVHLADCEPNLLDTIATLDFPELGEWEQFCAAHGLSRPARIRMEAAAELNEAYAAQEQLRPLLDRHRRLALRGAALHERLGVLRELAAADPGAPFWTDDVRDLERTRLGQLEPEVRAAARARDLPALERLLTEMRDEPWVTPVSDPLRQQLENACGGLRGEQAITILRGMVPQVREAVAAICYDDCIRISSKWGEIVTQAGVRLPDDLRAEIVPLNQWLELQDDMRVRENRARQARGELSAALDAGALPAELNRLYRLACDAAAGVPNKLEEEYRRKLAAFEKQRQNEGRQQFAFTLTMVIVVAAALLALIAVGLHTAFR